MLKYTDGLQLDVTLDNKKLPDNQLAFDKLIIVSDTRFFLPMMILKFADQFDVMSQLGIQFYDGMPIKITIANGSGNAMVPAYEFRMYAPKITKKSTTRNYSISGIMDVPKYLGSAQPRAFTDTTSNVVKSIAEECGLEYDGTETSDSQTWHQANKTNSEFVQYLRKQGYAGDDSLMSVGVTPDKVLHYLDLNAIEDSEITLGYGDQSTVPIVDHRIIDKYGQHYVNGFGSKQINQQDDSEQTDTNINPRASQPAINTTLRDEIGNIKINFTPIFHEDDVHTNWAQTTHQNDRGHALNTSVVDVLTQSMTDLTLFKSVQFDPATAHKVTAEEEEMNTRRGKYVVTGHQIYVVGQYYAEKFRLTRAGVNDQ